MDRVKYIIYTRVLCTTLTGLFVTLQHALQYIIRALKIRPFGVRRRVKQLIKTDLKIALSPV